MRKRSALWAALLLSLMMLFAACQTGGGGDGADDDKDKKAAGNCDPADLEPAKAAAAGLVQVAGVTTGPAQGKPTMIIGAYGDRTGGNSSLVLPSHDGAKLAIDQANAKGDLPVTLEFKPIDNKDAKPETAPAIAQQFIGDEKVIAVMGGGFSGETRAVGQLFSDAGMLLYSQEATATDLTKAGWKTFLRGVANDDSQGGAVVQIFKHLGCEKVGVIDDESTYGAGLAESFTKTAGDEDLDVVLDEGVEKTTDYTTLVDSIIAEDPQAVFYAGYIEQFQLIAKQLRDKGFEGVIASGDGSKSDTGITAIGAEQAENIILTCACPDINLSKEPKAVQFVKDFTAAFNQAPGIYAAEGYDVMNNIIAAIGECGKGGAGGVTRACVADKARTLKYEGITKTFDFDEGGQVKSEDVSVFIVRGGAIKEVGLVSKLS
ncbi:MAG TPA: branched-chain amino acid ABC transporter substrate-binding protein [Actinomycetota bacterium]|nr:branched-chain amino acid ABC transporter substrate-binding protein [Actinomycetota bacterium]